MGTISTDGAPQCISPHGGAERLVTLPMSMMDALRIAIGLGESPLLAPAGESENYILVTIWSVCATLLLFVALVLLLQAAWPPHP